MIPDIILFLCFMVLLIDNIRLHKNTRHYRSAFRLLIKLADADLELFLKLLDKAGIRYDVEDAEELLNETRNFR